MLKVMHRSFIDLGLNAYIVDALNDIGYKNPLPIQIQCIPYLLSGFDLLGMAHTGSGKTAAFILPLLHSIDIKNPFTQGLVLAPTRELSIQIGMVCSTFAKYIKEINVVTIYGGQNYSMQFRSLKKNPHIIVGTPGRLLDHLRRGSLNLFRLKTLIIDEADEMLRMGFIEDVKNIIGGISSKHQTALFSATLPISIRKISHQFMNNPKEVYIHSDVKVCGNIQQSYWVVNGITKQEALMRFLETESYDAAVVFVRTKSATLEISGVLERFGYNSSALNGDMDQTTRNQTVDRFRAGKLDILIATDVAARGLDVHRISLVINYDIPINADAYVHRIGRTGRAGCIGKSMLFVERQEYRMFRNIERAINVNIPEIQYPPSKILCDCRVSKFMKKIAYQLQSNDLSIYQSLLSDIKPTPDLTIENLAAVLLKIAQGNRPLVLPPDPSIVPKNKKLVYRTNLKKIRQFSHIRNDSCFNFTTRNLHSYNKNVNLYRISAGRDDGIKVSHIIDMLANKVKINCHNIGYIRLFSSYSIVELIKKGLPNNHKIVLQSARIFILNKTINIKFLGSINSDNLSYRKKSFII